MGNNDEGGKVIIVCAWCLRFMGMKESSGTDNSITHGMCEGCKQASDDARDRERENRIGQAIDEKK